MGWVTWVQEQPAATKALISGLVLLAAIAAIVVIWQRPPAKGDPQTSPAAAATVNSAQNNGSGTAFAGNNSGVVATNFYEAPARPSREEREKELLAHMMDRREAEAAERAKLAAQAIESRKRNLVQGLQQEYLLGHDNISSAMMAGMEWPSDEWMNKRLDELGQPYIFRGLPGGQFEMRDRP